MSSQQVELLAAGCEKIQFVPAELKSGKISQHDEWKFMLS